MCNAHLRERRNIRRAHFNFKDRAKRVSHESRIRTSIGSTEFGFRVFGEEIKKETEEMEEIRRKKREAWVRLARKARILRASRETVEVRARKGRISRVLKLDQGN